MMNSTVAAAVSSARQAGFAAAVFFIGITPVMAQSANPAAGNPVPAAETKVVPYTVVRPEEPGGDRLDEPRRLAAAVVAQDTTAPKNIVDIGSDTGEFLEAFMQQFPAAKGQWTEPVTTHRDFAIRRLSRFGPRISYVIGCAARDLSDHCVPPDADVLITSWLQVHQGIEGIRKYYRDTYKLLPVGGWVAVIDHVRSEEAGWDARLAGARHTGAAIGLNALTESPPIHRQDPVMPTLADQISAVKAAGFTSYEVVWRRLDTVLLMARKS